MAPVLFSRSLITGRSSVPLSEEPLPHMTAKKPRRKWMSVADLVSEVEQAMVKGVQLDDAGPTYESVQLEMKRLRGDNDRLTEKWHDFKIERAKHVEEEEAIEAKLKEDHTSSRVRKLFDDHVVSTHTIRKLDFELAALRSQNKQNIADVGILKLSKSRIENMGSVSALVDRVKKALKHGEYLASDGPEAEALKAAILQKQEEFDKVVPKIRTYGKARDQMDVDLAALEAKLTANRNADSSKPGYWQALDHVRQEIMGLLRKDKRMLANLDRLRQLQIMNTDYIGVLERARAKLFRHAKVHSLLEAARTDRTEQVVAEIREKVEVLSGDLERLRASITEIEDKMEAHAEEGQALVAQLRSVNLGFTSEAGKQRELLFTNIHQEETWLAYLAVLRGEILQKLHFICLLNEALH